MFDPLMGIEVVVDAGFCEMETKQIRFPRSRRRRIRKKWAKQISNFRVTIIPKAAILMGRTLLIHPELWAQFKQKYVVDGEAFIGGNPQTVIDPRRVIR